MSRVDAVKGFLQEVVTVSLGQGAVRNHTDGDLVCLMDRDKEAAWNIGKGGNLKWKSVTRLEEETV